MCIMDKYPITIGHFLTITKNHYENIFEMPLNKASKLFSLAIHIGSLTKKSLKADGLNIGQNNGVIAGQLVPHVHIHCIPRYKDEDQSKRWVSRKLLSLEELKEVSLIIKQKFK